MDKPRSKPERTRAFIIGRTAEIFNRKGYAGTSLSDLTGATGLTKGSIYGNFENKEEVALAAFDYNYATIARIIKAEVDKAVTYHDKLKAYAEVYRRIAGEVNDRGGCPILNTAIEADDTNAALKARASAAVTSWHRHLSRLLRQGISAGEFIADTPVEQLSLSIIALIEGAMMIARVQGAPGYMDQVLNTVNLLIAQVKVATQ
ncbi:TetR/AcrR family transcriptional regulator [Hufsiella ginkgonis]|uniref:TetR family transcriptional regulator n=1 Tax=Hufsiella ginkgonis TaxID=2695274 RepID=A0A7K1Y053_9SPHI|nr:TetR/AcrR family transcriptional regulator [Hufsiella ginkgonis]MXV16379.1 TetR family transcriptional regulator [Hufsiella ginkgonis]